jgi:hypothetical protein
MRHLGTWMLLAAAGMLLFPSLWEGRLHIGPGAEQALPFDPPGQSTLRPDDLLPPWRGPAPKDNG